MGLVTADEFRKARVLAETGVGEKEDEDGGAEGEGRAVAKDGAAKRKKKRKQKKLISTLSFGEEIEEDETAGESGMGAGPGAVRGGWVGEDGSTFGTYDTT